MHSHTMEADSLAQRICGPGRYKFDVLVKGIRIEQERLQSGSHLVVLWHQDLDFDGLSDWLYIGDAFESAVDGRRAADHQLDHLLMAFTNIKGSTLGPWRADSVGKGGFMPKVDPQEKILRVEYEREFKLQGSPFNRLSFGTRVLGPFPGPIVGPELFELLTNSRHELWSFFLDAGEAAEASRPRRTPMQISGN